MADQVKKGAHRTSRKMTCFLITVVLTFLSPISILITSPFHSMLNIARTDKAAAFKPAISEAEKNAFKNALIAFNDAVHLNITYFLYGGTLLGSYRHHDMIPWDDDLDLLVNEKDKDVLKECLTALDSEFELNTKYKDSWKFSHKDSIRTRLGWKWPFLDIFFFNEDDMYIWDIKHDHKHIKYKKTDIFPLIERPFMDMMFPAPRNTSIVLKQLKFDFNKCMTNTWNHKEEKNINWKNVVEVPCDVLKDKFPFVRREHTWNETIETLYIGNNDTFSQNFTTVIIPLAEYV